MKILYVMANLSGGGAERQLTYLASGMVGRGHTVHIGYLHAGPDAGIYGWYSERGVALHQIPAVSNHDPRVFFELFRLARRERYDLIQTCTCMMDVLGGLIAIAFRIPWILREPNSPNTWRARRFAGLRRLLARFSSHIVANSSEGCRYWEGVGPSDRRSLIHNAFPIAQIREAMSEESHSDGTTPPRPYVLYVGRLEPHKNVEILVEAFLQWNRKDRELWIVGDGSLRENLERTVSASRSDRIRLLGVLPPREVWNVMRDAQFLALLSEHEGFPNVVAEAAILECPVLLSDTAPHRAIWHEQSAVFVDQQNQNAIVDAMDLLSSNAELRRRLAKQALKIVREFSLERMVDAYLRIYANVVKEAAPVSPIAQAPDGN
jgi:glycosyltransferase involved in cell wall biosynthesis